MTRYLPSVVTSDASIRRIVVPVKPMLILHISSFALFSDHYFERGSFTKTAFFSNEAVAATNLLVSLFCSLVARRGRKRGNRQTDGQTYGTSTATLAVHARGGLINVKLLYQKSHWYGFWLPRTITAWYLFSHYL